MLKSSLNDIKAMKEINSLSELSKLFFRCVKWRLSQNDCKNRGFILINCLLSDFMCDITFFDQKKKLLPQKQKVQKTEEEEAPEEEEAQEDLGDEENGPSKEAFYPESVIVLKSTL